MLTALVLMLQATAAPPPPRDVIVTARPLAVLKTDLDACIARHCPPEQEIAASLAYAEAQFVAGDYPASRRTLLAARHRNARYAAQLPVEVSGLHRANARLADLNGEIDSSRIGVFDTVDALKAGLSRTDERVLAAKLEAGDAFAHEGRIDDAMERYGAVLGQARRIRSPAVEGMALFRRAALLGAAAGVNGLYRPRARQALKALHATTDPAAAPFRNAGELIAVFLLPRRQREAAIARAVAKMEPIRTNEPLLAYQPQIVPDDVSFGTATGRAQADWADVAFTVAADGSVRDVSVLQSTAGFPRQWAGWVTGSLARRRYMPMAPGSPTIDAERVERYSFVSDNQIGGEPSHQASRSAGRRVVVIDLSTSPPNATKPSG